MSPLHNVSLTDSCSICGEPLLRDGRERPAAMVTGRPYGVNVTRAQSSTLKCLLSGLERQGRSTSAQYAMSVFSVNNAASVAALCVRLVWVDYVHVAMEQLPSKSFSQPEPSAEVVLK